MTRTEIDISNPPDDATAIKWIDTDWVECVPVVRTHRTSGPGVWLTDGQYTGDAETCACNWHAEWRRMQG